MVQGESLEYGIGNFFVIIRFLELVWSPTMLRIDLYVKHSLCLNLSCHQKVSFGLLSILDLCAL